MKSKNTFLGAVIALFAAVVCAGCFMRIPLGVIPIVLQNALCVLTGVILGGYLGGAPTLLFLIAGLIGLPVYSGGTSGIAVWMGPTGGFLPGYLLGAVVAGFIAGRPTVEQKKLNVKTVLRVSLAMLAGMVILYVPGLIRFANWAVGAGKVPAEKTVFMYTMGACCIPFLPGDFIKIIVCIPVALKVRPILANYMGWSKE